MRRVSATVVAAAGLAAALSGCGSSSSLDPKIANAYVDAQAHALCVVQSKAFPTQAALDAAYTRTLKSSGLSEDELAEARAAEQKDDALRTEVSDKVAKLCG